MRAIDLKNFARFEQKIPSHYLVPNTLKAPVGTRKILSAYFFDFMVCVSVTSLMVQIFNLTVEGLLVTKGLRQSFHPETTVQLSFWLLPVFSFFYFFMSYFMNHGQSWGMHMMKSRIEMESQNFYEAHKWAFHSIAVCFTSGIYYFFAKENWKNVQGHDYLYQELMIHKDDYSVDLLEIVDSLSSPESEFEFKKAA